MKKLLLLLFLGFIGTSLFLACEDDIDVPQISFNSPSDLVQVEVGDSLLFDIQVSSVTGLEHLSIVRTRKGVEKIILDTLFESAAFNFNFKEYLRPSSSSEGTVIYTVYAEDKKKDFNSEKKTIIVENSLSSASFARIYNAFSDTTSAYDLVNDQAESLDSTLMDLIDQTSSAPFWEANLGTGNTTRFFKTDSIDFSKAKLEQLEHFYNDDLATTETGLVEDGDVFILKNPRFPQTFMVLEITDVLSTITSDEDYVEFRYRK